MRSSRIIGFMILVVVTSATVAATRQHDTAVDRTPIGSTGADIPSMATEVTLESWRSHDSDQDAVPLGRIRAVNESAGIYALEWKGGDGHDKSITYHRPDTVRATIAAALGVGTDKKYRFQYTIRNDEESGQYLSGFVVQTLSQSVAPVVLNNAYVGKMSAHIAEFSVGSWYRFGNNIFLEDVVPGAATVVEIDSDSPAAIVQCKIHGGPMKMTGIGAEMPPELVNHLLGYESWPSGYTIGPSNDIRLATYQGRATYLLSELDRVIELGWMARYLQPDYKGFLSRLDDEESVEKRIRMDLKAGRITSEIVAILGFVSNEQP